MIVKFDWCVVIYSTSSAVGSALLVRRILLFHTYCNLIMITFTFQKRRLKHLHLYFVGVLIFAVRSPNVMSAIWVEHWNSIPISLENLIRKTGNINSLIFIYLHTAFQRRLFLKLCCPINHCFVRAVYSNLSFFFQFKDLLLVKNIQRALAIAETGYGPVVDTQFLQCAVVLRVGSPLAFAASRLPRSREGGTFALSIYLTSGGKNNRRFGFFFETESRSLFRFWRKTPKNRLSVVKEKRKIDFQFQNIK